MARHCRLTNDQKAKIIQHHLKHPDLKADKLAYWAQNVFKLPTPPHRTTIGNILHDSARLNNLRPQDKALKRARVVKYEMVESCTANWVLQMQHQRISVSGDMIKAQAKKFAERVGVEKEMLFSNGWLDKFKKRNGFGLQKIHGESGDAEMDGIEEQLEKIKSEIGRYDLENVYNMDETGLFYNLAPDKTIAQRQIEGSFP